MSDSQVTPKSQDFQPTVSQAFGSLRTSIIINAVVPLVIYLLASPHMATLAVFALMAAPPRALFRVWLGAHAQHRSH